MNLNDKIDQALALLTGSQQAMALTGAGISTPSGIPDFRSQSSGLWTSFNPLEVASIYAFKRRPQDFYDWIHPIAKLAVEAEPNVAHLALAQLESHGPLKGIVTQNVDMLHSRAGSKTVFEVHGHLREVTCVLCYSVFASGPLLEVFIDTGEMPCCEKCGGVLKPNVILFGEQLPVQVMNEAYRLTRSCDLMLVVGSSLAVAPVGDLPSIAVNSGARLIIVNNESTNLDHLADVVIHADVVDVLPKLAAPFLPR